MVYGTKRVTFDKIIPQLSINGFGCDTGGLGPFQTKNTRAIADDSANINIVITVINDGLHIAAAPGD